MHKEYVEVCQKTKHPHKFDRMSEGESFTLLAFLAYSLTQDDVDSSDWVNGYVALLPVGDYQGGSVLYRRLGLQVEFPHGSCALFRGHELYHSAIRWTPSTPKDGRFCCVLAIHESIRNQAQKDEKKDASVDKAADHRVCEDELPNLEAPEEKSSEDTELPPTSAEEHEESGERLSRETHSDDQVRGTRRVKGNPKKRKRSSLEEE